MQCRRDDSSSPLGPSSRTGTRADVSGRDGLTAARAFATRNGNCTVLYCRPTERRDGIRTRRGHLVYTIAVVVAAVLNEMYTKRPATFLFFFFSFTLNHVVVIIPGVYTDDVRVRTRSLCYYNVISTRSAKKKIVTNKKNTNRRRVAKKKRYQNYPCGGAAPAACTIASLRCCGAFLYVSPL